MTVSPTTWNEVSGENFLCASELFRLGVSVYHLRSFAPVSGAQGTVGNQRRQVRTCLLVVRGSARAACGNWGLPDPGSKQIDCGDFIVKLLIQPYFTILHPAINTLNAPFSPALMSVPAQTCLLTQEQKLSLFQASYKSEHSSVLFSPECLNERSIACPRNICSPGENLFMWLW